eukprot:scaffold1053_cov107-Isochrysis_galbana.AAC.25
MRRHGKARLCGSRCKSGTRTVSPEAEAATGGWLCQDAAATSDEPLPPVSGLEGDGESDDQRAHEPTKGEAWVSRSESEALELACNSSRAT